MKLDLEDEDDPKPTSLTPGFFSSLLNTDIKKKGVVQILSLKKKKQFVYSTRLSDGFFVVKVMIIQKAAEQIQKQKVGVYYVIEGLIKNHGNGGVILKQKMRFWPFAKQIGQPFKWQHQRQNINTQGSNFILWDSQDLSVIHGEKSHKSKSGKKSQILKEIEEVEDGMNRLLSDTRTLTMEQNVEEKPQNEEAEIVERGSNIQREDSVQTQSIQGLNKQKTQQQQHLSKQMQQFLEILFDSDQESNKVETVPQKPKSQIKKDQRNNSKVDLQFIFDGLEEIDKQMSLSPQKQQQKQKQVPGSPIEEEDQDISNFLQWINYKKQAASAAKTPQKKYINEELRESILKKKREMYKQFMESSSQQQEEKHQHIQTHPQYPPELLTSQKKPIIKNPHEIQLKFEDIYNGLSTTIPNWFMKAVIRCVSEKYPKDYVHVILSNQTNQYLMPSVFINYSHLQEQLQEGRIYKLGKGAIKSLMDHNHWNSSHCEVEFDCTKSLIQISNEETTDYRQSSSNYTAIDQVYQMEDGDTVNVFGLIKSIKQFQTKNGPALTYQIVDPILAYGITLTKFDYKIHPDTVAKMENAAITIYNAGVSSYKGKKNMIAKPKTIIKVNWLPLTKQAGLVRQWLEDQTKLLEDVDWNLIGFLTCRNLSKAKRSSETQVHIRNVTILDFNSKFTYPACVKCFKKVVDFRCRSCGKRNQNEIIDKLFLRGTIGDDSTVLPVIWNDALAQKMIVKGFQTMEDSWALKKVEVWMEKGNNDFISILKVKQISTKQRLQKLLSLVKGQLL